MVNHVVTAGQLDVRLGELLAQLAAGSPTALRRGKYTTAAMENMDFYQATAFAEGQIALAATSPTAPRRA